MNKRLISSVLLSPLLLSTIAYSASAASDSLKVKLQIGNKTVVINDVQNEQLLQPPFIKDAITYVPIRFISERLKAGVKWDQKAQRVTIVKDNKTIVLTINSKSVIVNNSTQSIESPALIVNGATFVPLRFISENLNTTVMWDQKNHSITIQERGNIQNNSNPAATDVKTDEDTIKEVLQKQIDYLNNKDAAGALSISYKPTETKEELQINLEMYNNEYTLESVTDISINGTNASALVSRIVKRYAVAYTEAGEERYLEVHMRILLETTLVKENGVWKVYRVANKGITNLKNL